MELAFRMQSAGTDAFDLSQEPGHILEMYGDTLQGRNMLFARRLAERGVRYVQVYHGAGQPWDNHGSIVKNITRLAGESDQPIAALLTDLKQRGMLDETLVIWGGEFGRTNYCQGKLTAENFGRDHHPRCFTVWLAGGGIRGGTTHGQTDPYGYNISDHPVHVHDLQATILHLLGIDHERLTFKYQGRHFRLTDVHGHVVRDILA
jgi:arylsulfatase A-like enzyme